MSRKWLIFIIIIAMLLNLILAWKAYGADLGVWGENSVIIEEDFETYIVKQLEAIGEDKLQIHQEQIKDKIVSNIKRPKAVKGINKVINNATRFYDPSFTLIEDVYNEKQELLFPRGTIINPLEKKSFDEIWIFIDGGDKSQVTFAHDYQTKKIKKIILTNGMPGVQRDGSFFFYDQAGAITNKLGIRMVPSVIKQAPDQPQILIEEIALDDLETKDNPKYKNLSGDAK